MSAAGQSAPASRARRRTPSIVRLAPQFVRRVCIQQQRPGYLRAGPESRGMGFLFGTVTEHLVNVQAMRPLSEDECDGIYSEHNRPRDVFERLLAQSKTDPELSELNLVGWFSTRSRTGLRDSDVDFHNRYFRRASDLAVVLKPEQNSDLFAELYARSLPARFSSDNHRRASLRVSVDEPPTATIEIAIPDATHDNVSTTAPVSEPFVPSAPPVRTLRSRWIRLGVVAGFLVAALLLWEVKFGKGTAALPGLRKTPPEAGVDLHATRRGETLLVSWNRRSPVVRSATEAVLRIKDGSQQHEMPLDRAQIASGTVLYTPASGDVLFRLELKGEHGANAESARVLDGWKLEFGNSSLANARGMPIQPANLGHHVTERTSPDTRSKSGRIARPPSSSPSTLASSESLSSRPLRPPFMPLLQGGFSDQAKLPSSVSKESGRAAEVGSSETTQVASIPRPAAPQTNTPTSAPALEAGTSKINQPEGSGTLGRSALTQPSAAHAVRGPAANYSAVYVAPRPLREVMPETQSLRALVYKITEIVVEVSIDQNGRVVAARTVRSDPDVNLALVGAAVNAAKQWRYEPATLRGQNIPSRQTIVFQIHPRQ